MEFEMFKYLTLLALSATAVASPALAQDARTFSGPRIEGIVGYDNARVEGEGADGVNYGIGLGYDIQRGRGVFGIEAEAGDSSADECIQGVTVANDELCAGARRDLYIGGRAGAVVGRNVLLYGKAGYTNARFALDYDDGGTGVSNFSLRDNLDGVRLGAGVEVALSPNAFVKAEYRYSNYEQGFSRNQGVAGFGFRF
jgi:outer membrane immunogenic protein